VVLAADTPSPVPDTVLRQQAHVLRAVPADALEQRDALDHLGLVEPTLTLAKPEIGRHQSGTPRERYTREMARAPACGLAASSKGGIQDEGRLGLEGQTRSHAARAIEYL